MNASRGCPALATSLKLRRTGARALGALGLAVFAWATLGLPALHALEHERDARADDERPHDLHALLRDVLAGRAPAVPAHHHHHDESGAPGAPDPTHGHGSAQHFSLAVLGATPPLLPPRAETFDALAAAAPEPMPASHDVRSPRSSRGPPPATAC